MDKRSSTNDAYKELLRAPNPTLLADYWLATDEVSEVPEQDPAPDAKPLLVSVMPRQVIREAREIKKRCIAQSKAEKADTADTADRKDKAEEADKKAKNIALKRLNRRYSVRSKVGNAVAPKVVAIARAAPWAAIIAFAPLIYVRTCHEAQVEVLLCAWYRTQEFSGEDSRQLRNQLSHLWISKFAIDMMKTLPDACTAELNQGKPSRPCVEDTIAALERIVISELKEQEAIEALDKKLKTWCPNVEIDREHDPAANARRLFDTDMVSSWLWPTLYFNGSKVTDFVPSSMSCDGPKLDARIDYERRSSRHHLLVYHELVTSIITSSCATRGLLLAYLPEGPEKRELEGCPKELSPSAQLSTCPKPNSEPKPDSDQSTGCPKTYVSITLHNVGDAPAELDVKQGQLIFESAAKLCEFNWRVKLDPYSHQPTPDLLPDRVSVGAGETLLLEVETGCSEMPKPSKDSLSTKATVHIKGLGKDVEVAMWQPKKP